MKHFLFKICLLTMDMINSIMDLFIPKFDSLKSLVFYFKYCRKFSKELRLKSKFFKSIRLYCLSFQLEYENAVTRG